jgi:hypothetical protein
MAGQIDGKQEGWGLYGHQVWCFVNRRSQVRVPRSAPEKTAAQHSVAKLARERPADPLLRPRPAAGLGRSAMRRDGG